ncbi:hypothetical protein ACF1E9_24425 [Streptomyces roseolus]|uniref:hypothetical protein n=1 Tax=Streptomyces roseolus TaxID=67358 RepID=UPI0036FED44F
MPGRDVLQDAPGRVAGEAEPVPLAVAGTPASPALALVRARAFPERRHNARGRSVKPV